MDGPSSGSQVSSKAFTDRELKYALYTLPKAQARAVRRLAQKLNSRTGIGYYASLDIIARIGDRMTDFPSSRLQISTEVGHGSPS